MPYYSGYLFKMVGQPHIIGVQEGKPRALSLRHTGIARIPPGTAQVFLSNDPKSSIVDISELVQAAVDRAIIDNDQFPVCNCLCENAIHSATNIIALVI